MSQNFGTARCIRVPPLRSPFSLLTAFRGRFDGIIALGISINAATLRVMMLGVTARASSSASVRGAESLIVDSYLGISVPPYLFFDVDGDFPLDGQFDIGL